MIDAVTAFAPASVGNVAVGFDLLGHALDGPGDQVTARRSEQPGARIAEISGVAIDLPVEPDRNTASRAVQVLLDALAPKTGVELTLGKGIPLASGLGGSAASAVAALVAVNALLDLGLDADGLYPYALAGEAVASGSAHGDNIGAQLLGGLVLATTDRLVRIPVPDGLTAVAVHPNFRVNTRDARTCLEQPFALTTVVAQMGNLSLLLSGCHQSRPDWIRAGLADLMVEPRRAVLIPGFHAVKQAALDHDALGASISGAGPTVFAWFEGAEPARVAGEAMVQAFGGAGHAARAFVSPVAARGARLLA